MQATQPPRESRRQQLNLPQAFADVQLADIEQWGGVPAGLHVGKPEQLFPRIEVK